MQLLLSEIMNIFIETEKKLFNEQWLHVICCTSKDTICIYIDTTILQYGHLFLQVNIHGNIIHKDIRDIKSVMIHSIDSLYSTNSVNVYVPSDNQQFRYKFARGW